MADRFDVEIRRLVSALVDEAPPVPPVEEWTVVEPAAIAAPTRRRVLAYAAVVVVAIVIGALALVLAVGDEGERLRPAGTTPSTVGGTWRELPTTFDDRSGAMAYPFAIDDSTLLTVFPDRADTVTGEIYRFDGNSVRTIAPSPLRWRTNASVAWTGKEVVIAGGSNGPGIEPAAAAYSPQTDSWRVLPAPPAFQSGTSDNQIPGPAVWTGDELISWQSRLAFDPATDRWRTIAKAPLSPRKTEAVVATDSGVFVWGGCRTSGRLGALCDEQINGTQLADGAYLDSGTGAWTKVPRGPLVAGNYPTAVWTGTEIVVLVNEPASGKGAVAAAYNPNTQRWRKLPDPPHPGGKYAASVWTGEHMLTHSPDDGVVTALDPKTEQWQLLPAGPIRDRQAAAWTGTQLVITGGYPTASPWTLQLDQ